MATDFTGKTALITGGERGIGRAVALGLAGADASLTLLARSTAQLAEYLAMLIAQLAPGDAESKGRSARAWRSRLRCANPRHPGVLAAATVSQKVRK